MNGGIGGSLTQQWVDLLLRVKNSFQPDVIVMVFSLRDGTRTSARGSFFEPIRDEIKFRNDESFYYQHVYLLKLYQDYRDRIYLSKKYSKRLNDSYWGNSEQTQEWENAKRNILKIKQIGEEAQVKVAMVVFPVLVELNDQYPFKKICEMIIKFGAESTIPVYDLLPAFMGKHAPDLWVSAFDQHPNVTAHAIAAKSMLPFLRQLMEESRPNDL